MHKRGSCLKEGAGWVERAGGGFREVNFEKKRVEKNERERETHRKREREIDA